MATSTFKYKHSEILSLINQSKKEGFITDEERKIGRNYPEYKKFVKEVLERDNYTCQITFKESDRVTVHHIEGYNWCKDKRTDIDNGIVLNEDIHKFSHKLRHISLKVYTRSLS